MTCLYARGHVVHVIESHHTYDGGMSHVHMSRVTHVTKPCHIARGYAKGHGTHVKRSRHTYEGGMSHI